MAAGFAALFRSVADLLKERRTTSNLKDLESLRQSLELNIGIQEGNFLFANALAGVSPNLTIKSTLSEYRTDLRAAAVSVASKLIWRDAALTGIGLCLPEQQTRNLANDAERRLTNCRLTLPTVQRGIAKPTLRYVHIRAKEDSRVIFGYCWERADGVVVVDDGPGNEGLLARDTISTSRWWPYEGVFVKAGGGRGGSGDPAGDGVGLNLRPRG